ncbi:hypothetical protein PCANC_19220 [Puccinia coronata f. sp. avenae]|uniref:Uncharacterized protein n=1 Tax=Puccinia coronata f. sp. avenae TaxID=200324 RepID=A0A2N5U5A8_9BASI|nr:hypothetical protein PCANC_19220 [Puccinia coronata f. sp. avenae]PLW22035.1 hypothetical protein PCASD_15010 [Puccinia coronata f. sp. avenae]PLW32937.1 hypothetical protein PCASD_12479 [Puccinia coronata f. sp. avenae]
MNFSRSCSTQLVVLQDDSPKIGTRPVLTTSPLSLTDDVILIIDRLMKWTPPLITSPLNAFHLSLSISHKLASPKASHRTPSSISIYLMNVLLQSGPYVKQ